MKYRLGVFIFGLSCLAYLHANTNEFFQDNFYEFKYIEDNAEYPKYKENLKKYSQNLSRFYFFNIF